MVPSVALKLLGNFYQNRGKKLQAKLAAERA
jgi:hypothetical protein